MNVPLGIFVPELYAVVHNPYGKGQNTIFEILRDREYLENEKNVPQQGNCKSNAKFLHFSKQFRTDIAFNVCLDPVAIS